MWVWLEKETYLGSAVEVFKSFDLIVCDILIKY